MFCNATLHFRCVEQGWADMAITARKRRLVQLKPQLKLWLLAQVRSSKTIGSFFLLMLFS